MIVKTAFGQVLPGRPLQPWARPVRRRATLAGTLRAAGRQVDTQAPALPGEHHGATRAPDLPQPLELRPGAAGQPEPTVLCCQQQLRPLHQDPPVALTAHQIRVLPKPILTGLPASGPSWGGPGPELPCSAVSAACAARSMALGLEDESPGVPACSPGPALSRAFSAATALGLLHFQQSLGPSIRSRHSPPHPGLSCSGLGLNPGLHHRAAAPALCTLYFESGSH